MTAAEAARLLITKGDAATTDDVIAAIKASGREPFLGGAYDLNIVAVRHSDREANTFNDRVWVLYKEAHPQSPWFLYTAPITTDPGTYYRLNPSRVEGTAVLQAGFHAGCWKLGLHKGETPALVQAKPVTVWRDNDRDASVDLGPKTQTGMFGINLHPAGVDSSVVDKWSAGCQVWKRRADHEAFLRLCNLQVEHHPTWDTFSYLLLEA